MYKPEAGSFIYFYLKHRVEVYTWCTNNGTPLKQDIAFFTDTYKPMFVSILFFLLFMRIIFDDKKQKLMNILNTLY